MYKLTLHRQYICICRPQEVYQRTAWTPKLPKMVQPDLDYLAPEIQLEIAQDVTVFSDMFSLGLVICAIHNNGHSLIQANHNISTYARHSEQVRCIDIHSSKE